MKVVMLEPGQTAQIVEIGNGLEPMQSAVDGYIEAIYPFEDEEVVLICNEEGKINGLPPNRVIFNTEGEIVDIIYGSFFICSAPIGSEEFESLSEEQIAKYYAMFEKPDFAYTNNEKKYLEESEKVKMKKYINNCNYCENTPLAIRLANDIVEWLNRGEYDDLDRAIYETVENNQIYYTDQWELLKTYQTPTTANYAEAYEMLISELYSIIEEEEIEEEIDEEELGEDEDER